MKINENIEILQGDCLQLLPKLQTHSVDSIIADPPYFLGITHNGQKGVFNDLAICKPFYEQLFKQYKRVLKPDGCIYFFLRLEKLCVLLPYYVQYFRRKKYACLG